MRWTKNNNFFVSKKVLKNKNNISCLKALVTRWALDQDSMKKALITHRNILEENETIDPNVLLGFWYLHLQEKEPDKFLDKIINLGGKSNLLRYINAYKAELGGTTINMHQRPVICAEAILRVINKGRRGRGIIYLNRREK